MVRRWEKNPPQGGGLLPWGERPGKRSKEKPASCGTELARLLGRLDLFISYFAHTRSTAIFQSLG